MWLEVADVGNTRQMQGGWREDGFTWILDTFAPRNQATMARGGRRPHEPQSTILWEPCLAPLYLLLWLGGYPHMISRRKDVEQSVPKGDCSRHLHAPLP